MAGVRVGEMVLEKWETTKEYEFRKPSIPTKYLVPPPILVRCRVGCRVRVVECSGRNKRFSGRII